MSATLLTPHAVARLRAERLARSTKPFLARGGIKGERCARCRLTPSHCICALRTIVPTHAGMCLLMADIEPLKPSNTGWLVADVVPDTFAFGWARTEVDPALLALLADPQWQPYVVFPGEFVAPERVVTELIAQGPQLAAGPPQGELAPLGGSDPRSGGAWGSSLASLHESDRDDHDALHRSVEVHADDAGEVEQVADDGEQHGAHHRAGDGACAALECGAAHDDGGNRLGGHAGQMRVQLCRLLAMYQRIHHILP